MAVTAVTPIKIELNGLTMSSGSAAAVTFTTGNTTDGNAIDFSKADNKTVILFNNTANSAGSAVIKSGDFIQGVKDLTFSNIPTGVSACVLDSGYFENKSKKVVVIPSAATVTVGAVILP